ncbi:MAG: SMC-Scp complex subunit ScpB [Chthoniobacter sp.]|nr:SMC-Scp complex subunit ScpB [Chthoniobacter sp.]
MTLKQVIEALVFASPKPLLTKEIVAALRAAGEGTEDQNALDFAKAKADDVLAALAELQGELSASGRAFQIAERINGWTLVSDPACAPWVRQLYPEAKPTRLSGPQLETLAIIAYRQPVTRADIEAVRGVAVDGVMQILLDRGLVKIAGRAEVPGRPLLYSTTEYFLEHFGLKTTDELPNASELKRVVLPTAPAPEETKPADPAEQPPAEGAVAAEGAAAEPAAEGEVVPANEIEASTAEPEAEPAPEPEPEPAPEHEPEPSPESEAAETAAEPPAHE